MKSVAKELNAPTFKHVRALQRRILQLEQQITEIRDLVKLLLRKAEE